MNKEDRERLLLTPTEQAEVLKYPKMNFQEARDALCQAQVDHLRKLDLLKEPTEWKEKPDSEGWWWFAYNGGDPNAFVLDGCYGLKNSRDGLYLDSGDYISGWLGKWSKAIVPEKEKIMSKKKEPLLTKGRPFTLNPNIGGLPKNPKTVKHPDDCQCGNHEAHTTQFRTGLEPKTVKQINTPLMGSAKSLSQKRRYADICEICIIYCEECKTGIKQQLIEEIDPHIEPFCGVRVSTLRDCLSYVSCEVRTNCFWFWWQQFKKGK